MNEAYVLDTTALFLGIKIKGPIFTTKEAVDEVIYEEGKILLEELRKYGLKIVSPPEKFFEKAERMANKVGEIGKLSKTDISLLALSLYLSSKGFKIRLITEDYALQNTAVFAGIEILSVRGRKISKNIVWEFYCPACGKKVSGTIKVCPVCGTPIKRRPKRRLRA